MSEYTEKWQDTQRRYSTPNPAPEAVAAVDRQRDELAQQRAATAAERAREFEATIRARFLQTGASPEDWEQEKGSILKQARAEVAVHGDNLARSRSAARYG